MVISISGAQCTGKTTLINALKNIDLFKEETVFMGSPSRKANDQGVKINSQADYLSQMWIYVTYVKDFIEAFQKMPRNIVSDRCLLDVLCYTEYIQKNKLVDPHLRSKWAELVDTITQNLFELEDYYDCHIILHPEFELIEDGVRSTDKDFQREIDKLFIKNVRMLQDFSPNKILYVTGSVEERVDQIINYSRHIFKSNKK